MKRRLSILLISLLFFAVGIAEAAYADGYFRYEITQNTVTIQGYSGRDSTVWVPESIAGRKVVKIAAGAFSENESVTQIRLPITVVTIESGAFRQGQAVSYYMTVNAPTETTDTAPVSPPTSVQEPQENKVPKQEPETVEPVATEQKPEAAEQKPESEPSEKVEQKEESVEQAAEETPARPEETEEGAATVAMEEGDPKVWYGIWTEKYHSTVSVDSAGRLVIVDEDGRVTRMDDSRTYTLYNAGDGFRIQDDHGEWVTVDEEGNVIVPARGGQVNMNQISNYLIVGILLMAISAGVGLFLWRRKSY